MRRSALGALALALAAAQVIAAEKEGKADQGGWLAKIMGASGSGSGVALFNSIAMIIATEIGDKTFCIAAVMAMRYNRAFVFGGAIGALIVMTILSVAIGVAVPTLLSRTYTHYAAAILFAYFGFKLLKEAREMNGSGDHDELRETEAELGISSDGSDGATAGSAPGSDGEVETMGSNGVEGGSTRNNAAGSPSDIEAAPLANNNSSDDNGKSSRKAGGGGGLPMFLHYLRKDWSIITQAFTLTFLAEWGDRSQIATIAMAAAQDPLGITMGAVIGHSMCTGLAVIGGRMLAARISERAIATGGGILFLIFAGHSFIVGPEQ